MNQLIAASPWYLVKFIGTENLNDTEAYNSQTDEEVLGRIVIVKGTDNKFVVFSQKSDSEEVTGHDFFSTGTSLQEASRIWLTEVNKIANVAANGQNAFYASQSSIKRFGV